MRLSKRIMLGSVGLFTLTLLVGLGAATAQAGGTTVSWGQIIGIIQPGNVVGSGAGAVMGAGQPWSATSGEAEVNLMTGDLQFKVEGLVLAGGNNIGTPGSITEVKGTLVCDTDGSADPDGNSTLVDTELVPLGPQGDAEFQGVVTLPDACINEPDIAFLIRIPADRWIANGAVRRMEVAEPAEPQ